MELGDIARIVGPMMALLAPAVRKAAVYMFYNRERGGEYDEHFRELLALARTDVQEMRDNVEEIRELCRRYGIDTYAPGGAYRIDARLGWYLALRQRRVLKKLEDLTNEFRNSVDGIADVIACLTGLTAQGTEGLVMEIDPEHYESESISRLSSAERHFQEVSLGDRDVPIEELLMHVGSILSSCDEVLQEFTEGISVGDLTRR